MTIKKFAVNATVEVAGLDEESDDAVAVGLGMPKAQAKAHIAVVSARMTPLMAQFGGPQDITYEADQFHIR